MIEFVVGPGGQQISPNEQKKIRKALEDPNSFEMQVNALYNNGVYFNDGSTHTSDMFVKELQSLINSRVDKIIVHGGIHHDAFGHTSGMIGQIAQTYYNTSYIPVIVQDTYIHITVETHGFKKMNVFNTARPFHVLMAAPRIVRLEMPDHPVIITKCPKRLQPTSDFPVYFVKM